MPSRRLLGLLALLDASSAFVQLDFQKERRPLSHLSSHARHRYFQRRAGTVNAELENAQGALLYLVNVTVGSDNQRMALQLDTGSSDIWLPSSDSEVCVTDNLCSNGDFDPSSSSSYNEGSNNFEIAYADGTEIVGNYFTDSFTIGGATIRQQTMALAQNSTIPISQSGSPFQGIVGVGFSSGESAAAAGGSEYPNLIDTLKSQGHISTLAYSLWLNDLDSSTGSILFGGVDTARYSGGITVLPIQPDSSSLSNEVMSFTVELDNLNVESGSGEVQYSRNSLALPVILDSGTTLTYLPESIATDLALGVGANANADFGIYVPCSIANSPATFNFGFGNSNSERIQVAIGEFVLPYTSEETGGQQPEVDGVTICQWGIQPSGPSDPLLFGDTFLRSAYVVYDLQNEKIGIAQTTFNVSSSDTDVQEITGNSIPGASTTATGASVTQSFTGNPNRPTDGVATASDVGGGSVTSTFDLSGTVTPGSSSGGGSGSGSGSNNPSQSGAAGAVVAPSASFVTSLTVGIAALSGLAGALMVLL